jgi:predicted nucleic acid-binding protein
VILYLDTSSLLKYYVDEDHSADVRGWIDGADLLATSRVTLVEAAAALSRRYLGGGLSRGEYRSAFADLEADWPLYIAVELYEERAAEVAWRHLLRGFDAVQLAAALTVQQGAGPERLAFSSFDAELNEAARAEGLTVLEPLD